MKAKKFLAGTMAVVMTAAMFAGCGGKKNEDASVEQMDVNASGGEFSASNALTDQIKMKYSGESNYEYAEPMYNLPNDYVFEFDNLSEEFFDLEEYECFVVYSDSALTQRVDTENYEDYDTMTMTIAPGLVFNLDDEEGSYESDGTWGGRSKFWLVQYYDIATGEQLEKPIVTIFTIARDLDTPTLEQYVQNDGYYALDWSEVPGADYYEVYEYDIDVEGKTLVYTTEDTFCDYHDIVPEETVRDDWDEIKEELSDEIDWEFYEDMEEEYGDELQNQWLMNTGMYWFNGYFVVARTEDGKVSGMSNICAIEDIAGQLPYTYSDDFQTEYYGDTALALPAYAEVEMVDGSTGRFLINYHNAKTTLLTDGTIVIEAGFQNLPISMMQITFSGMEYEAFMADTINLTARQDQLLTQALTAKTDMDIPYTPSSNTGSEEDSEIEDSEFEDMEDDWEEEQEFDDLEEVPEEEELEPDELEEEDQETEDTADEETEIDLSTDLAETVVANSALSEWIAINLLNHETEISLSAFNEAADSEYLADALMEAYTQNPLIGIMDYVRYNYDTNSLELTYVLSAEDTAAMQEASLKKADEIVKDIITDDMNEFEKEEAINNYLCENASYNDEIMQYINEDGTISEEAVEEFAASFTPYGILVENYGVCESYSEAFLLLAKAAGLEAVIETGRLDNVNHEWNRVKIDGSWYSLDVTNNDNEYMPNCYFNLPDEVASAILLQDNDAFLDSCMDQYTSEGMDYEYYNVMDLYTEDAEEAATMLADQLSTDDGAVIRMDLNYGDADIAEIIQNALYQSETEEAICYYNAGVIALMKK